MSNSGLPASSAPVERVISQSGLMMHLNRAKMSGKVLEFLFEPAMRVKSMYVIKSLLKTKKGRKCVRPHCLNCHWISERFVNRCCDLQLQVQLPVTTPHRCAYTPGIYSRRCAGMTGTVGSLFVGVRPLLLDLTSTRHRRRLIGRGRRRGRRRPLSPFHHHSRCTLQRCR